VIEIFLSILALAVLGPPLGIWLWKLLEAPHDTEGLRVKVESKVYALLGVDPKLSMTWKAYAQGVLLFNLLGYILVYLLQRAQALLPLNPAGIAAVPPDLAFNTATSFVSNTNWQSYSGESALSYLTQMVGLTSQNFLSAATGIVVLAALCRGLASHGEGRVGNCWVDLFRVNVLYLLPLSALLALLLVGQGVVQTLHAPITVAALSGDPQTIALGPAASQIAIKQLGTNGGGFYGVNSAHPLENPTPLSNFLECISILLIPVAVAFTYGKYVGRIRHGLAALAIMTVIFAPALGLAVWSERQPTPALAHLGQAVDFSIGNMEGKELRFGPDVSALWASYTTAASNGSVNSMHDSFNPLGGMSLLFLMLTGEVVFGGVGCGLYGMLIFIMVSVFIAGQLVGRSPEFLGKKIEAGEIKLCAIAILVPCAVVLLYTAAACWTGEFQKAVQDPLPHGFSELLYCTASMGNNNGSAFAGFGSNRPFFNLLGGLVMLMSRFWILVPVLALAGSLSSKKSKESSKGTLPTDNLLFVLFAAGVVVLVGALTFLPALALGPIAEFLSQS
jgi:K+-transporting ATPase ATPase A chain